MADEHQTVSEAEDNSALDSSTSETNTLEVDGGSVNPEHTEKATDATDSDSGKVNGATKRIHKLVDERDRAREEAESLKTLLADYTSGNTPRDELSQFAPTEGEERELTIDDIRTIARLEAEKTRTVDRINNQAQRAIELNPVLNKDSDQYDPDVNEAVTTAVFNEIRLDPSKDVLKLTEKYLKPYRKAAENAVGQEKKNIVQQVNEQALRPSTVKSVDKDFAELSLEEMEARLGSTY